MWLRSYILPFWRRLWRNCPSLIARCNFLLWVSSLAVVVAATARWTKDEENPPHALVHWQDVRFWLQKLKSQLATATWLSGHLKMTSWSLQLATGDLGTSYVDISATLRSTVLQCCTWRIWVIVKDRRQSHDRVYTQSFLSCQQGALWTTLMATQIGVWALKFPFKSRPNILRDPTRHTFIN